MLVRCMKSKLKLHKFRETKKNIEAVLSKLIIPTKNFNQDLVCTVSRGHMDPWETAAPDE